MLNLFFSPPCSAAISNFIGLVRDREATESRKSRKAKKILQAIF